MEECLKAASIIQMAATGALATRLSLTESLSSGLQCPDWSGQVLQSLLFNRL